MSYYSLADFLEDLGRAGDLLRVQPQVDSALEVAEITDRVARHGRQALLFAAVRDRAFPLVTNLLATEARICRSLGAQHPEDLTHRVAQCVHAADTEGWLDKIKGTASRAELRKLEPRVVRTGPCQQVVRLGADVDLTRLPALQCHPAEFGPIITTGQVLTTAAHSPARRVGRHDLRILDRNRLVAAWFPHDDLARCFDGYRERHRAMPVAIAIGGHPAALLAAMAPLPPDSDRLLVAGLLRGKPLDIVRCRTIELEVPAEAELVLEGTIDPDDPGDETGPLVGPGGTQIPSRRMPVIHVSAMTHRTNPVFPAIVPRGEPDEASTALALLHRAFLPLVQTSAPELVDYHLPTFGAATHVAFVSIHKDYAGQARKVASVLWGLRQLMFAKLLLIVDADVDVRQPEQVWSAVASRADFGRDLILQSGPPDPTDPAAEPGVLGQRLAIDATRKLPEEGPRQSPAASEMPHDLRRLVSQRWPEYRLGEPA